VKSQERRVDELWTACASKIVRDFLKTLKINPKGKKDQEGSG
jgi:hypothetical protein